MPVEQAIRSRNCALLLTFYIPEQRSGSDQPNSPNTFVRHMNVTTHDSILEERFRDANVLTHGLEIRSRGRRQDLPLRGFLVERKELVKVRAHPRRYPIALRSPDLITGAGAKAAHYRVCSLLQLDYQGLSWLANKSENSPAVGTVEVVYGEHCIVKSRDRSESLFQVTRHSGDHCHALNFRGRTSASRFQSFSERYNRTKDSV
jgi:hypothetical protein